MRHLQSYHDEETLTALINLCDHILAAIWHATPLLELSFELCLLMAMQVLS